MLVCKCHAGAASVDTRAHEPINSLAGLNPFSSPPALVAISLITEERKKQNTMWEKKQNTTWDELRFFVRVMACARVQQRLMACSTLPGFGSTMDPTSK